MTPPFPASTTLGYPRIGRRRELKHALEAFWSGSIDEAELERRTAELRSATRARLVSLGLDAATSAVPESFSYYDQVLDAALAVGAVPERFADLVDADGEVSLAGLFTIARGDGDRAPVEMTKWFDSNYHYSVPEISPSTAFSAHGERLVSLAREARHQGIVSRPVLVGPVTLLALAKPADGSPAGFRPLDRLDDLVPVYALLLADLAAAGVEWVQLDEPAVVSESTGYDRAELVDALERAHRALAAGPDRPALFVSTSYGPIGDGLAALAAAGVEAIGLDLVRGTLPEIGDETRERLAGVAIVAGVVDGRTIWRGDLAAALARAESARSLGGTVSVSPSTTLLHIPHDIADEPELDAKLRSWLAFADQKIEQVVTLARGLAEGSAAVQAELEAAAAALADRASAPGVRDGEVRARVAALTEADARREPLAERQAQQSARIDLPVLPTTTIGSFPQTGEVRRARAAHRRGELDTAGYERFLEEEIERVVRLQEELGLDVIVHGEPERNDMVQYFAENLDGFATTTNGWVQSYGSRATRPSIIWGDVSRPQPITVRWATYTQSLTAKPVKGMLTGPVTILAWSFPRDDQPLAETALQVALALRDEVVDLEAAGIAVVQVDEPALRELLPLTIDEQADYLNWSVRAFRVATSGVKPQTQIHTHLCYSEFGVVIDAVRNLDADVTSIEAARSRMEVVASLRSSGFAAGIGPGVYDIHSPRIPGVDEITRLIEVAVDGLDVGQLWVNPDCGLKTRGYDETTASLRNLIAATERVREQLSAR